MRENQVKDAATQPFDQSLSNLREAIVEVASHQALSGEVQIFLTQLVKSIIDRIEYPESPGQQGLPGSGFQPSGGGSELGGAGATGDFSPAGGNAVRLFDADQTYLVSIDPMSGNPLFVNRSNGRSLMVGWGTILDWAREKGIDEIIR